MKIEVYADADAVALEAARLIAKEAREAVAARGRFVMAVSGGKTPWIMLRDLAQEDVPWKNVHVVQVELARRLYMDEATLTPNTRFDRMRGWCADLVGLLGRTKP